MFLFHHMDDLRSLGHFPLVDRSAGLSSEDKCLNFNPSIHLISFNLLVTNSDNGFCDLIQCSTRVHIESVKKLNLSCVSEVHLEQTLELALLQEFPKALIMGLSCFVELT